MKDHYLSGLLFLFAFILSLLGVKGWEFFLIIGGLLSFIKLVLRR
ncbi:hypothetical protein Xszus_02093 [Xenorhabdus szentirmaii]|nr:hypothetical protein Xszus_00168 [Xenorhabdus szentirmaii]PHM42359.1 hypothetical protein Xszus_02093 [Xenorhabdus szentirmaii]